MPLVKNVDVNRHKYWKGQSLRSGDFRSQVATEEQLRRWHNRAFHNSFGIVEGLKAELVAEEAVIAPGLAYDCGGRLLFLPAEVVLPLPSEAWNAEWILLLQSITAPHDCNAVQESCGRQPQVRLCWIRKDRFEIKHGVPLGILIYLKYEQEFELQTIPSKARGFTRPYISFGTSIPGSGWELWDVVDQEIRIPLGLQIRIDTFSAGFTETPCYFAWLRSLPNSSEVTTQELHLLLVSFIYQRLVEVSHDGFTFQLPLEREISSGALLDLIQKYKLTVLWIGVQPLPDKPHEELGRKHHGNH